MEVKKHIPFSGDGGQVAPEGFHGVMVSTLDSESSNPSSNLGGTFLPSWKKNTFYSLNRIGPARGLPRASVAGSHGHGGQVWDRPGASSLDPGGSAHLCPPSPGQGRSGPASATPFLGPLGLWSKRQRLSPLSPSLPGGFPLRIL